MRHAASRRKFTWRVLTCSRKCIRTAIHTYSLRLRKKLARKQNHRHPCGALLQVIPRSIIATSRSSTNHFTALHRANIKKTKRKTQRLIASPLTGREPLYIQQYLYTAIFGLAIWTPSLGRYGPSRNRTRRPPTSLNQGHMIPAARSALARALHPWSWRLKSLTIVESLL